MTWLEPLRTSLDAVRTHRLRSGLTMVGIMIGIAAVILTVGLGQGAEDQVAVSEISAVGTQPAHRHARQHHLEKRIRGGSALPPPSRRETRLALDSKTVAPDIKAVAPVAQSSESLTAGSASWTLPVAGTTPAWETVRGRSVTQGRFIDART